MRGLMAAVIGMGVLIVAGVTVLVVVMVQRMSAPGAPNASAIAGPAVSAMLEEPAGTRIAGVSLSGERIAVQLGGGGPDRVLIVDTRSGRVVGRVSLVP